MRLDGGMAGCRTGAAQADLASQAIDSTSDCPGSVVLPIPDSSPEEHNRCVSCAYETDRTSRCSGIMTKRKVAACLPGGRPTSSCAREGSVEEDLICGAGEDECCDFQETRGMVEMFAAGCLSM